jgi:large subunit ribosomal protein L9
MQVVLRSDILKVGKRGDVVTVADGYARNYLLPRGHAIVATDGITKQAQAMRNARDRADAKNRAAAESQAQSLVGITLTIAARAGDEGKLFGSVTNADIVDNLKAQHGFELERRQVELHEPIKTVGRHDVPVRLHTDVQITLAVEVEGAEA